MKGPAAQFDPHRQDKTSYDQTNPRGVQRAARPQRRTDAQRTAGIRQYQDGGEQARVAQAQKQIAAPGQANACRVSHFDQQRQSDAEGHDLQRHVAGQEVVGQEGNVGGRQRQQRHRLGQGWTFRVAPPFILPNNGGDERGGAEQDEECPPRGHQHSVEPCGAGGQSHRTGAGQPLHGDGRAIPGVR